MSFPNCHFSEEWCYRKPIPGVRCRSSLIESNIRWDSTFTKFECQTLPHCSSNRCYQIYIMAPHAEDIVHHSIKDVAPSKKDTLPLPSNSRARLEKAGIDLSAGYPYRPARPLFLDDVYNIRNEERAYADAGSKADPEKKALLSAAKDVIHLTRHIGTEIVGLQLKDLTDQQKDELALLIAERSVVFFRDQDISPQEQRKLGEWFGEVEVHVYNTTL
jgi:hypothetical protein